MDEVGNPTMVSGIPVTLDSAVNPGGWPLLVDTSLTKESENGVVSWTADDHLRINKAVSDYQLSVSGFGDPLVTDTFDIVAGADALLRFSQQPNTIQEGDLFDPPVSVEVIDRFGNRTSSTSDIDLTLSNEECGDLSGASETAAAGLATFDELAVDGTCSDTDLLASGTDLVGATSDEFDIQASNEVAIGVKNMKLKRNKLFRLRATGTFPISKDAIDDPTKRGALLTVTGESGSVRYKLPKSGWKKLGNAGFKFEGRKCQSVIVKKKVIAALCNGKTGTITLPEDSLEAVLSLGKGTARFCGECGGDTSGDETKVFKHTECEAPSFCP